MTENELLQALQTALNRQSESTDNGFLTTQDIMQATDLPVYKIHKAIRALMNNGRIEVGKVQRTNIAGVTRPQPAYRLIPPTKSQTS